MENVHVPFILFVLILSSGLRCYGLPLTDTEELHATTTENVNDTLPQDLYIIRTLIYEVGILTDADNSTEDNSTEISHQVDLTFYDPKFNGSNIDLSNIPLPIQTNISGITVTGFAPANLGSIPVPPPGETIVQPASALPIGVPILPDAIVTVSHNISTTNPEKSAQLLSDIPNVQGLRSLFGTRTTNEAGKDSPGSDDTKTQN